MNVRIDFQQSELHQLSTRLVVLKVHISYYHVGQILEKLIRLGQWEIVNG